MSAQPYSRSFALVLLLVGLLLASTLIAGCSPTPAANQPTQTQPAPQPTSLPAILTATPLPTQPPVESNQPANLASPEEFKAALLQALMDQDTQTLVSWMTSPFLTGGWRADASDTAPEDALQDLYTYYLGADNRLEWVEDADLTALMGGRDPLFMPRTEAGVFEAALVSGWGLDGRDEAILFLARLPDGSLKWHGWIVVKGGFSGARLGGLQPYTNHVNGYSIFIPKGYEIDETNPNNVIILAPGEGHPGEGRAAAFIIVKPAGDQTVEQIVEQFKADISPGFEIPPGTALGLDKAFAIVLGGLPGQDSNRQLFTVYNNLLYNIYFVPDNPKVGEPYWQMEDLYAQIVNTFRFTQMEAGAEAAVKAVTDFYASYDICLKNPPAEAEGKVSEFCQTHTGLTTAAFAGNLEAGGTAKAGADPVFCAQDIPETMSVSRDLYVDADNATASVLETFGATRMTIRVDLLFENGVWKIDNIICPIP
jgi:hypothetical protein